MLIPKPHLAVDVEYWNSHHQAELAKFPKATSIQALCGTTAQIDTAQLLTYTLFKDKDKAVRGFSSYADLASSATGFNNNCHGIVDFNGASICITEGRTNVSNEYPERLGEATGLCIINRIHGLHGADWDRIPDLRHQVTNKQLPIFDYMLASDSQDLVQVENKGSIELMTRAQARAKEIEDKKAKIRANPAYPLNSARLYGTVALVPALGDGNLKCWLLDPPALEVQLEPSRVKLIHRMRFLSRMISSIGPRTQFASALANRLGDLEQLRDISELDGQPLLSSRSEPLELANDSDAIHYPWFSTRSTIQGKPAGGAVVETRDGQLFFFGIRQDLLDLAREQSHKAIRAYGFEAGSSEETVNCVVSLGRAKGMKSVPLKDRGEEGYVRFEASGPLWWNEEGLVFGWLQAS
jgi:hypothetical protein